MRFRGLLYRALNPVYAREPLSGEGARRYGGRFNPRGVGALYTSLSPHTAIRESNQVGTLQPTTLVAYEADLEPILDARSPDALAAFDASPAELAAADWRERMRDDGVAPTQRFARRLIDDGYAGLLVRSFARGAGADDLNLVLYSWGDAAPTSLRVVVDHERRLR